MYEIILESQNSDKKYKCPYCDERYTRIDLVHHIGEEHEDMIPQNFTPARIVFNYINKKEHGTCIMCKAETEWNEEAWKYNRICEKKKCHDDYVTMVQGRMIKRYGKANLLNDEKQQKIMLSKRKISGTYTFTDGGKRTYCGSYERKLLEFYDKVLQVKSEDIMTPGPTIEYQYNNETHKFITDLYYIPANLVHDVKDGGSNPNTREMPEYRGKQEAKEKAIAELGMYNYIRLTDNNFEQLLLTLAKIKEQLMSVETERVMIIDINEEVGGIPSLNSDSQAYIMPCYLNNSFVGTAVSKNKYLSSNIYTIKDGKIKDGDIDDLNEYSFKVLKVNNKQKVSEGYKLLNEWLENKDNKFFNENDLYKCFVGHDLLSYRQMQHESCLTPIENSAVHEDGIMARCIHESLMMQYDKLRDKDLSLESTNEIYNHPLLSIREDKEGYFVYNESTQCRSKSFKSTDEIDESVYQIMDILKV